MSVQTNKLIAKFVGGLFNGESKFRVAPQDVWLPKFGICRWDTIELGKGKTLQYHKSWDWLMTAVDKIESLGDIDVRMDGRCFISDVQYANLTTPDIKRFDEIWVDEGDRFKSTYNAVIEFINYYNKNKEKFA